MAKMPKLGMEEIRKEQVCCKENMQLFWVPRYVSFVGSLPRTRTGRIQKFTYLEQGVTPDTYDRKA